MRMEEENLELLELKEKLKYIENEFKRISLSTFRNLGNI
jgi:biotin synthase-related radical SAM superfamily protein